MRGWSRRGRVASSSRPTSPDTATATRCAWTCSATVRPSDGSTGRPGYMMMRSQRPREGTLSSFLHHEDEAVRTRTTLDPRVVVDPGAGGDLAISALAPGIRCQLG